MKEEHIRVLEGAILKKNDDCGFSYFYDKRQWANITREERYFCAQLFHHYRNSPNLFVNLLIENWNPDCEHTIPNSGIKWDLGYEVCFFRDYLFFTKQPIKQNKYPAKRTFDLCLFSEEQIIIIEAKAQQGFSSKQLNAFRNDRELIPEMLHKSGLIVSVVALKSSNYCPNDDTKKCFDAIVNWNMFSTVDPVFIKANSLYESGAKSNFLAPL